jgi:uncharacterized protein YuzE
MTLKLDQAADALYIRLSDAEITKTLELNPDMYADVDAYDNVVGIEILNVSTYKQLDIPPAPVHFDDLKVLGAQYA